MGVTTHIAEIPKRTQGSQIDLQQPFRKRRAVAPWSLVASIAIDVLLVCLAGLIAYRLRNPLTTIADLKNMLFGDHLGPGSAYMEFLVLYAALLVSVALSQHVYNSSAPSLLRLEVLLVLRSVFVATVLMTTSIYLSGNVRVSRLAVGLTSVLSAIALTTWRALRDRIRNRRLAKGMGLRRVLIVGAGRVGRLFAAHLEHNPSWGYEVQGFLDCDLSGDPRVLGDVSDLARVVRKEFIDEIFITIPTERELVKEVVLQARQFGIATSVIPDLYDGLGWQKPVEHVGDFLVRVMYREPIPEPELFLKRLMDIIGSAIGLIVLSPLFALVAMAVKLDSPGPVFYRAKRVGRKGRQFVCHKFRTMVVNADKIKDDLRHLNERQGPFFKITDDPRITPVGRLLRRYSLDELPQLWNVFCGEMSLVGPRPHPLDDYNQYTLEHLRRLDITPGITCLWQIIARGDPSFDRALALDNQYIENWSFLLDLRILLQTIPALLKGSGS